MFTAGFFLDELNFSAGVAEFAVSNSRGERGTISCQFVRSLLFYKESDFYEAISKYEHEVVIPGGERTTGVFRVNKGSVIEAFSPERLLAENPQVFWLSTPDECIEILAFDTPTLTMAEPL